MRNRYRYLLLTLLVALAAAALVSASGEQMSVQIRKGQLRATPSFLGAVTGSLDYGDRVELMKKQGPWLNVRDGRGRTGWIHESALTTKRIVMSAGDADVRTAASGEELALAGKGFNSDVETEFKVQHADIDFDWVDRMEAIAITPEQAQEFLSEGQVQPATGGAR